jgi:rfaE bifunctional protein nucleotidyltransferase chain/domain
MTRLEFLQDKILALPLAKTRVETWKHKGDKIVFTNGCFDILHKGHVTYLAKAAALGQRLVVAVNTDDSVRRLGKSPERPINAEDARLTVIAALGFVDLVILFNNDTPLSEIELLQPDVLVKGADYDPNETDATKKTYIVGSDIVRENGGEVRVIELEAGFSTTNVIAQLRK